MSAIPDGTCQDSHTTTLPDHSEHHQLTATESIDISCNPSWLEGVHVPINDPNRNQSREEVSNSVETGQKQGSVVAHAHRVLENFSRILSGISKGFIITIVVLLTYVIKLIPEICCIICPPMPRRVR